MATVAERNAKKLEEVRSKTVGSEDYDKSGDKLVWGKNEIPTIHKGSWNNTSKQIKDGYGNVIGNADTSEEFREILRSSSGGSSPKPQTSVQQSSAQNYIDQLNNARKQAALAGLDKSRQQSLSNLQEEKSGIQPRYYDARNQTASSNQQQARNFAEFMASRGGSRSGANAQAEISRQGVFQGNIGSLNRQENQAYDNIDRRTTDVNNAYESDVQSANAGIEAERMQALINQMNADRQFGLQEGGLMGTYNGQQTLAAQGQAFNQGIAEAGLTGMYNGQQTLGGQQLDLQRSNQEFNQNMAQEEFAYQQARDQIIDQQFKMQFDEDARRFGLNYALDKQVRLGGLSQQAASLALSRERFNYQQQQDARELELRQQEAQQQPQEETLSPSDLNSYAKFVEGRGNYFDEYSGEVKDKNGLRSQIIGLNLPDSATDQLLRRYGLDINTGFNYGSR